jgi:hypothetical protein
VGGAGRNGKAKKKGNKYVNLSKYGLFKTILIMYLVYNVYRIKIYKDIFVSYEGRVMF